MKETCKIFRRRNLKVAHKRGIEVKMGAVVKKMILNKKKYKKTLQQIQ